MRGKDVLFCYMTQFVGITPAYAGKVIFINSVDIKIRITPAYAGKRAGGQGQLWRGRDHPRVCGEKFSISPAP